MSYRHLEEMMEARGVFVDHSSINRWAIRFLPLLEKVFRKHKHPVGGSWRMDETYSKVKGAWKYLYALWTRKARRDKAAALRNEAAMDEINARGETPVVIRQVKYLNNIVKQDHLAIKRDTRPMLNCKSFRAVKNDLAGIELMHMIRKGQFLLEGCTELSFADQSYAWAGKIRSV